MVAALPEELVDVLQQQILLRESQIHQLSLLYNVRSLSIKPLEFADARRFKLLVLRSL